MAGGQDALEIVVNPMNQEREVWGIGFFFKLRSELEIDGNKFPGKPKRNRKSLYLFMQ